MQRIVRCHGFIFLSMQSPISHLPKLGSANHNRRDMQTRQTRVFVGKWPCCTWDKKEATVGPFCPRNETLRQRRCERLLASAAFPFRAYKLSNPSMHMIRTIRILSATGVFFLWYWLLNQTPRPQTFVAELLSQVLTVIMSVLSIYLLTVVGMAWTDSCDARMTPNV